MKKRFLSVVLIGLLCVSCFKDADDNLRLTLCDTVSKIVSESEFSNIETSNYIITDVELNGDCLQITIQTGGCDPNFMGMGLYSPDAFYGQHPANRQLKVELDNNQLCDALFSKTVSFDVTPLRLEDQNELELLIDGWQASIVYVY